MHTVFRDPALQRSFERNGYVVADCFDLIQVASLTEAWLSISGDLSGLPFSTTLMSRDLAYRHRIHILIAKQMAPLLDRLFVSYRLSVCGFLNKSPVRNATERDQESISLHQDWTFVDESKFISIGIWCPLVDVDSRNGCLSVVPGSHLLNHGPRGYAQASRFPYSHLEQCMQSTYLKELPLRAGQAVFFTHRLFHSSLPNLTESERLVAGGIAVPTNSQLQFVMPYQHQPSDPEQAEPAEPWIRVYKVPQDFYLNYLYGSEPPFPYHLTRRWSEPLDENRLHAVLRSRKAARRLERYVKTDRPTVATAQELSNA
jgi:Phytanoyl-CoA dioxygenase (PhyH)